MLTHKSHRIPQVQGKDLGMKSEDLDYRSFNPLYPLYAKKVNKGLSISRIADDTRIATVVLRDTNLLAGYEWDRITGRRITVFFKDGTARVHDAFQGGKLMSLLRISKKAVDGALWDRIELTPPKDVNLVKFDYDITKTMPQMVRFARDSRQIFILPYEPPNRSWRLATDEKDGVKLEKQIVDVHMVHKDDNEIVLMFDGAYVVQLPGKDDHAVPKSRLHAIFATECGLYLLAFQDGTVESLDLNPFIENESLVGFMKCFISMTQLGRYLQNHLELIQNDLIAPCNEFFEKVCDRAFGYQQLHEELEQLLLIGSVSNELEDWLCNTVNEKNSKKWRKLSLEMYQKSNQILTLAFIPACERLILLSERSRGYLRAIQVTQNGAIKETSCLANLMATAQSILKLTLETIQSVKSQEILFQTFWHWFDDKVHEALDEDYKPKLQLHGQSKTGYEIAQYLDQQIRERNEPQSRADLFNVELFKVELNRLTAMLASVRDQEIQPHIMQNLTADSVTNILINDKPQTSLVGLAPLSHRPIIICFLASLDENSPVLSMRLLDKITLQCIAADYPVKLPLGLEDRQVENVLILKASNDPQDPQTTEKTVNRRNTRLCFTVAISRLQEDADQTCESQQLSYQCEITEDLRVVLLTMHEPSR